MVILNNCYRYILLLSICFYCCSSMAQYDTVYRDIKELRVNQKSFLRSLTSASKKDFFCKIGSDAIYTIRIKDKQDGIYTFSIKQYCVTCRMLRKAKGYIQTKNNYYFILGSDSLTEYPEGLFAFTGNHKNFKDISTEDFWLLCGSDCSCAMDFEYKNKKLNFICNEDENTKYPLKEIALPDPSLEKSRKKLFDRRHTTLEISQ